MHEVVGSNPVLAGLVGGNRPPRTSHLNESVPYVNTTRHSYTPDHVQTVISRFQGTGARVPMGPLTEDHQCCRSFPVMVMSLDTFHVDFKMVPCPMSILCHVNYFFPHVVKLHIYLKKWPCHCVEFRGHQPDHLSQ